MERSIAMRKIARPNKPLLPTPLRGAADRPAVRHLTVQDTPEVLRG
jgi:hypothetical protein